MQEITKQGKDVESAIDAGLQELGLSQNDVDIEIIDRGSRGLLGLGSRDAVVKITVKAAPAAPVTDTPVSTPKSPPSVPPPAKTETIDASPPPKQEAPPPSEPVVQQVVQQEVDTAENNNNPQLETAVSIVENLLTQMGITATVSTSITPPDDLTGKRIDVIEINGNDLTSLIGPRGETLNAMQFLTRLMVGHKIHERADFVIDIEGYRHKREVALSRLAERMAKKAVSRGRPIKLEAMPPHERRIIHMALRKDNQVQTESVGEGKNRKVQIIPK